MLRAFVKELGYQSSSTIGRKLPLAILVGTVDSSRGVDQVNKIGSRAKGQTELGFPQSHSVPLFAPFRISWVTRLRVPTNISRG